MSYGNRSYGDTRGRNFYGSGATIGQSDAGTMTVLAQGDRFATVSAYTGRDGKRMGTVTLCINKPVPAVLEGCDEIAYFGAQVARETMPVADALKLAQDFVFERTTGGDVL